MNCRACGNEIRPTGEVLDLGLQPLANHFLKPSQLKEPELKLPLTLLVCERCWMLQLRDTALPESLFKEYNYFTSCSAPMVEHARVTANRYVQEYSLTDARRVIEIASNDGYMLQHFKATGIPCLGIEPAVNVAKVARDKGIETVTEFFGYRLAAQLAAEGRGADLILANNVLAHAPDINDFVAGLRVLARPYVRIILEFPYARAMIERTEFDTIYHEHVFYFTLTSLIPLFLQHGLEIYDVEQLSVHGGALRIFVSAQGQFPVRRAVNAMLAAETLAGVSTLEYFGKFAGAVERIKDKLVELLAYLKADGASIGGYGASAKSTVLLNYCGIGPDTVDFIADTTPAKQGAFSPGMHIPVVPDGELLKRRPDYALLLIWNFMDRVLEEQKPYRLKGGKFIAALPVPRIID